MPGKLWGIGFFTRLAGLKFEKNRQEAKRSPRKEEMLEKLSLFIDNAWKTWWIDHFVRIMHTNCPTKATLVTSFQRPISTTNNSKRWKKVSGHNTFNAMIFITCWPRNMQQKVKFNSSGDFRFFLMVVCHVKLMPCCCRINDTNSKQKRSNSKQRQRAQGLLATTSKQYNACVCIATKAPKRSRLLTLAAIAWWKRFRCCKIRMAHLKSLTSSDPPSRSLCEACLKVTYKTSPTHACSCCCIHENHDVELVLNKRVVTSQRE